MLLHAQLAVTLRTVLSVQINVFLFWQQISFAKNSQSAGECFCSDINYGSAYSNVSHHISGGQ